MYTPKPKIARYDKASTTSSLPSPKKQYGSQVSKVYPKSLSVVEMLKLGNVIAKNTTTVIDVFMFNIEHMEWSTAPMTVEFRIADHPFASGGFREAFKATSDTPGFSGVTWVIKKYLKGTLEDIIKTNQTVESHTRKAVQMHHLARNFTSQLKEKVEKETLTEFGTSFHYKKVFLGKMSDGDYVTIEEFIDGVFVKYINNNGDICTEDDVLCDKAQCFAHFTYEKSKGKLMVLDVQGAGLNLYDPEIASAELTDDDGSLRFCNGNLADGAIKNFFAKHNCNFYCRILQLKLLPSASQ